MPKHLLEVPHHKQQNSADCLAACASMTLAYLKKPIPYPQLLETLQISSFGAPSFYIQKLATLGLSISYSKGSMAVIHTNLLRGLPIIVFVDAGEFAYWTDLPAYHTVVVIGFDGKSLYLNDLFLSRVPQVVHEDEFLLAWSEHDYRYAVINL